LDSLRRRAERNYFMRVTGAVGEDGRWRFPPWYMLLAEGTHSGGNDGTSIRD
jgi:hypothetical protein